MKLCLDVQSKRWEPVAEKLFKLLGNRRLNYSFEKRSSNQSALIQLSYRPDFLKQTPLISKSVKRSDQEPNKKY
jgi:hypothetical protein